MARRTRTVKRISLRQASDEIARTPMHRIDKAWHQRFNEKWTTAKLVRWLVQHCGMTPSDAEDTSLDDVADLLDPVLTAADRDIRDSFTGNELLLARELAQESGVSEREVKERLRPSSPLMTGGYVVKGPPREGYRAGLDLPDL